MSVLVREDVSQRGRAGDCVPKENTDKDTVKRLIPVWNYSFDEVRRARLFAECQLQNSAVCHRFFYRTAALGPIFECTHVVHLGVPHIVEHLTSESRATARCAIDN